jgi:hypothetical protein
LRARLEIKQGLGGLPHWGPSHMWRDVGSLRRPGSDLLAVPPTPDAADTLTAPRIIEPKQRALALSLSGSLRDFNFDVQPSICWIVCRSCGYDRKVASFDGTR